MPTKFADHVLTGDHASRPAASAVPEGTLYSCTDHNLIYQSDGTSAWSTWSNPGAVTDAELAAIAGLTSAADKGIQFTGSGTAATYDLTAFAKTILDDANAAAALTTLGAQPLDAELSAIAGLASAADKGIMFTGAGAAATFDLTAAGLALLDDAAASNQRTTLGLGGAAVLSVGTSAGTVAAGDDARFVSGGTGGVPAAQEYTPDRRPSSPNVADDEFDQADGTAVDTAGTRFTSATAWVLHNDTGATIEQRRGALIITAPSDADAMDPRGVKQVLPAGDWEFECSCYFNPDGHATYAAAGMGLLENGTNKALHLVMGWDTPAGAQLVWQVRKMTAATTWSANSYTSGNLLGREHRIKNYFRIARSGSNLIYKFSENGGHSFASILTVAQTTDFTTAPDRIVLFANARNGTATTAVFPHFRRIS